MGGAVPPLSLIPLVYSLFSRFPSLFFVKAGAFTACTFHFFYNAPILYPMVAAQAGLTVVGNATMAAAAWRIWCLAEEERKGKEVGEGVEGEDG